MCEEKEGGVSGERKKEDCTGEPGGSAFGEVAGWHTKGAGIDTRDTINVLEATLWE